LFVDDDHRVGVSSALEEIDIAACIDGGGGHHVEAPAGAWRVDRKLRELKRKPRRAAHQSAELFGLRGEGVATVRDLRAKRQA